MVVWTDLKSNFAAKSKLKQSFSVVNAFAHLQLLPADVKAKAADYISRAPSFVDTPLRRAIKTEPWFETLAKQTITEGKHA